jgi:DNA-binding response OmpR family regulator
VTAALTKPIDDRSLVDIIEVTLAVEQAAVALIVEDDQVVSDELRTVLSRAGYNPISVRDGRQGLAIASGLRPQLVLIDLWAPLINGFQMLNVLRQNPATRTIPVIALTDVLMPPESLQRVLQLGATTILTKPLDFAQVELLVATQRHMPS